MEYWLTAIVIIVGLALSFLVQKLTARTPVALTTLGAAVAFVVLAVFAKGGSRLALIVMAGWMIDKYLWRTRESGKV